MKAQYLDWSEPMRVAHSGVAVWLTACSAPRHSNIWSDGPCRARHQLAGNSLEVSGLEVAGRWRDSSVWRGSCWCYRHSHPRGTGDSLSLWTGNTWGDTRHGTISFLLKYSAECRPPSWNIPFTGPRVRQLRAGRRRGSMMRWSGGSGQVHLLWLQDEIVLHLCNWQTSHFMV